MQTRDNERTERHGDYYWLVVAQEIRTRAELVARHHTGMHCCITAFDSGPLSPNDDELSHGWRKVGDVLVSPPLSDDIGIPHDQYDEWYVLSSSDFPLAAPELFVNYGAFRLVSPAVLTENDDPTWDRRRWDFLVPLQERFWAQMAQINPESFVASGDLDIVVSRYREFVDAMRAAA